MDGGAWLYIEGTAVDWIHRDLDRVDTSWREADQSRFDFHFKVGHPLGVPDFAYAGGSPSPAFSLTLPGNWRRSSRRRAATRRGYGRL